MGKVKTRFLGLEEVEKKQKEEQKKKSQEKQTKKVKAPGKHKGGEKMTVVEASQEALAKMKKAEQLIKEEPFDSAQDKVKKAKTTKLRKRGKKYQQSIRLRSGQAKKIFSVEEAIDLLKKMAFAKFDESVELHINTVRTGLRGELEPPYSSGKTVKVKIVSDTVLKDIEKGKIDFDILITHPSYMPKIAPLAKILGPKGLMPNPKTGTISEKPQEVAKKFSGGLVRWKTEAKFPIVHQLVGKVSYADKKLVENIKAFITKVGKNNIKSTYLKSTMSPALALDIEKL